MYTNNDSLFSGWLIIIFLYVYIFHAQYYRLQQFAMKISSLIRTPSLEEQNMIKIRKEINALEIKAEKVNTPQTFSKWAKINRQMTQLKDDESALNQVVEMQKSKRIPLWIKLRVIQIISFLFLSYYLYGQSLAPIPLGMKSFWLSNITPFSWFIICYVVVKRCCSQ
eukprot:UN10899